MKHVLLFCLEGEEEAFEIYEYDGFLHVPPKGSKVILTEKAFSVEDLVFDYEDKVCRVGVYVKALYQEESENPPVLEKTSEGDDGEKGEGVAAREGEKSSLEANEDTSEGGLEAQEDEASEGDVHPV